MFPDFRLSDVPETPAFVYDEIRILDSLQRLAGIRRRSAARILYSIKACPLAELLELMRPSLDGFAASSLFEARFAAECLGRGKTPGALHLTSPGLRPAELGELSQLCSHLAFNSLEQFRRLAPALEGRVSPGLRINPCRSFLDDPRYDPCRPHSKLGVPLENLAEALAREPELAKTLRGLHFHTAYESASLIPLRTVLAAVEAKLGLHMEHLEWINVGGGYRLDSEAEALEMAEIIGEFGRRHGLETFIEPGRALVADAGMLVASVVDRFERDGRNVLVLDTGVHHLPEVFEYQRPPVLAGHRPEGRYSAILAGCSCLAGDLFGEYRFERLPDLGERVAFCKVGAYALVKASRFNGFDLPALYARQPNGSLRRLKQYGYDEFRRLWVADPPPLAATPPGL